ncbi:MAG TPA: ATP-binding protein [Dysgonomonas sp.]|uniref:ATP-binding protein n=1 Tax=unclassified Dysgonomonas TaxID=2630389 RepID=UPI0025C52751|nr:MULTISPECIES: ATP-binding protein [unclassified Dysgonomonas]HML65571.1 ATP-binding protein [Dysgonomonas sp.]
MAVIKKDSQPFQPYARLMNILGDQLITDKKVAVIEVVKNSYDADADNVKVRFFNMKNYGKKYIDENELPYIEIEDDGDGMTLETIQKIWLRPATPNKLDKKKRKENHTEKGRIIQGEKGVGRFAIHKLGERIDLYTKTSGGEEVRLEMDFTEYNPEDIDLFNQPTSNYKLLNDVHNTWYVNDPAIEIKKEKGTLIRIQNLRERWTSKDFEDLYKSILRLIPPVDENAIKLGVNFVQDFTIELFLDNELYTSSEATTFKDVVERAQYSMIGEVSNDGTLYFEYNSVSPKRNFQRSINLLNKEDLSQFQYPTKTIEDWFIKFGRLPNCGSFKFTFYAFNLKKRDKTIITTEIDQFIKQNFVYLLRDGVRVYPYGEKGYDWLELDKLRSTVKAGDFISYNDLIGFVYITQENNTRLKDSTNRQGIMDVDGAFEDFKRLLTETTQILNTEKKIDENKLEISKNQTYKDSNNLVLNSFNSLKSSLKNVDNRDVLEKANKFLAAVHNHTDIMRERMETVEDLAGLGMAVERSSHDSLTLLAKMRVNVKDFKKKIEKKDCTNNDILALLDELDENLNFVYDEMQVIQPLFKNQRKAIKDISIHEIANKVVRYFRRDIEGKINVSIQNDGDIIVKTNTGLILQILINLLDNAIYWVNKNETSPKEITIKINSRNDTLIIADNGPGIREDTVPLIYNEFFSLKSDGRGLGLYIVKEILLRINGEISIIQDEDRKLLSGANFIIKFNQEQ